MLMFLRTQVRIAFEQAKGLLPCSSDDGNICYQIGEPELRKAALPGAQDVARAPQRQIDLGDTEAIRRLFHGLQPDDGGSPILDRRPSIDLIPEMILRCEKTIRLMAAPAYAATQLMQLGQTESLGILDEHDGGVGHVDADFDDGGSNQDVEVPVQEGLHRVLLLVPEHLSMKKADLEIGKHFVLEHLMMFDCGLQFELLAFLDERIDDVGLRRPVHE